MIVVVSATLVAGIVAAYAATQSGVVSEPALSSVNTLSSAWSSAGSPVLGPSPSAAPAISAQEAVNIAWQHRQELGDPTEATATYATYSDAQYAKRPVWLVTFRDSCVPVMGKPMVSSGTSNPGDGGGCYTTPYVAVVDAASGEWLLAFADGSTDPGALAAGTGPG